MKRLSLLAVAVVSFLFSNAQVQTSRSQKVVGDKIVAKIGDRIILYSDIQNAIADAKRQGAEAQLPPNPECFLLEAQLVQKALVIQAGKDSLTVPDDELEALLDNQVRGFIREYGSKEVLEEIAGKSVYQLKEDFREPFRDRKLAEQMRGKIVENIKITPTEVKAYYDKIPKDSLAYYESEIEVSQVVVYPKANRDIEDLVIRELYDMKRQVEAGQKKFDQLAKLYSEDPGSKETGGQYSINRNDKVWDPAFLSGSFKLKEGQISPVIKSKFGYHIIQMVSRAGDDAVVRHILKIPSVTEDEINDAKKKLDSVRSKVVAGTISFNEAVNKYSDDENSKFSGGAITSQRDGSTYLTIDMLDKDIIPVLQTMKVGDISQPVTFTDERGKKAVRLITLKSRTDAHRENLKDDYNRVSSRALEEKKQSALEKWFRGKIPNFYVQIDPEFAKCSQLDIWLQAAATANK